MILVVFALFVMKVVFLEFLKNVVFPMLLMKLLWRGMMGGSRIVKLGVLAEGLGKCHGSDCDTVLDLSNIVSEKKFAFGTIL